VNAAAIYKKLRTLVAETLGVEEDEVTPDASFQDDLNADDQELADLLGAIEEEFEIKIADEDLPSLLTVGDAVDYLEDALA
jgi:acyl carrier protein